MKPIAAAAIVVAGSLAACGGGGDSKSAGPSEDTRDVAVAPPDGAASGDTLLETGTATATPSTCRLASTRTGSRGPRFLWGPLEKKGSRTEPARTHNRA